MLDEPTLTVVDNSDGTATATIAGSTAGSSNAVETQAVDGELGSADWTEQGTRIGDGTVNLTLDPGYYWFRVVSTLAGESTVSNLVYLRTTDGSDAVLYQCLEAVQARIQGLLLAGIDNDHIQIAKVADDRNRELPAIVISPIRKESIDPAEGTNVRDDVGYPVLVTILAADNQDQSANFEQYLAWREDIRRAFHNQRLPGVEEIITASAEPEDIVDRKAWSNENLYVSGLLIRFVSREPRG